MDVSHILKKDSKYLQDLQQVAATRILPRGTRYPLFTKPIVDKKVDGGTAVLINNESFLIPDPPANFQNFLFAYLATKIPSDWYEKETRKSMSNRHPIARWISNALSKNESKVLLTHLIRLAFDIYTLENHNCLKLDRNRLLNKDQFWSYRYELLIACLHLESAFEISWKKFTGDSIVEFDAFHLGTKVKWAIECKRKDRINSDDLGGSIKSLQKKAYDKNPDSPLCIFVDANLRDAKFLKSGLDQIIEQKLTSKGYPVAIVITNLLDIFNEGWPKVGYIIRGIDLYPKELLTLDLRMKNYPLVDHLHYVMGSSVI